jgi:hypothetical protein
VPGGAPTGGVPGGPPAGGVAGGPPAGGVEGGPPAGGVEGGPPAGGDPAGAPGAAPGLADVTGPRPVVTSSFNTTLQPLPHPSVPVKAAITGT